MNKKNMASLVVVSTMLCMGLTACGAPNMERGNVEVVSTSALLVEIENPVTGSIALDSKVIGTVQPKNQAEVFPKSGGTVTAVNFSIGDYVQEGKVLVTLDSDSLTSAQINIQSAQLQLETAQKSLERIQELHAAGAESLSNLESAENAVKSAQLQLATSEDNYHTMLKNTQITAPMSGVIESKNVERHDSVSAQQAICVISQKDVMQVVFQVSERVKQTLTVGQEITIEKNGSTYSGTIQEIDGKTTDNTGLFEIKANISQADSLSTGSRVSVELVTQKAEGIMIIPLDAVYYDNGQPYVYVSNDGIAEVVYIETGIYDKDWIEVVSGLDMSHNVITSWSSQLTDGVMVEDATAASEVVQ